MSISYVSSGHAAPVIPTPYLESRARVLGAATQALQSAQEPLLLISTSLNKPRLADVGWLYTTPLREAATWIQIELDTS